MSTATISLSLVSHTNVGKTTLARTLLGRDVGEVLLERKPRDHVNDVAEVGALVGTQTQLVADRDALGPLLQGLGLTLVGDLVGRHLLFLQPLAHVAQGIFGLVEVDGLGAAAGGGREVLCGRVEGQVPPDGVVQALQAEEHLIRLAFVFEIRRLVGLQEVEVEISRWLGSGALIRRTKK